MGAKLCSINIWLNFLEYYFLICFQKLQEEEQESNLS